MGIVGGESAENLGKILHTTGLPTPVLHKFLNGAGNDLVIFYDKNTIFIFHGEYPL